MVVLVMVLCRIAAVDEAMLEEDEVLLMASPKMRLVLRDLDNGTTLSCASSSMEVVVSLKE